jgi:phosphatidylethanolamine/phosphatidyl-N-methylethanolamine N-methyltransferase
MHVMLVTILKEGAMSVKSAKTSMPLEAVTSFFTFGSELLNNPRPVGSAVPSSRFLARRIAGFLPRSPKGYVVELGAGTGAITSALLDHGIPGGRVVAVERSATMVRLLQRRFPSVNVAFGDAAQLRSLLSSHFGANGCEVSHIVSSLPLRSLPEDDVASIIAEIQHVLHKNGKLLQYTYDLRRMPHRALAGFQRCHTTVVWANFPPARVDVFQKPSTA